MPRNGWANHVAWTRASDRPRNKVLEWMREQRLSFAQPRKEPDRVYIRFGLFDRNRCSYNFYLSVKERGLSVYRATLHDDGTVSLDNDKTLLVPPHDVSTSIRDRFVFVLAGKEVGTGSDGEPVIRGPKLMPYAVRFTGYLKMAREYATPYPPDL